MIVCHLADVDLGVLERRRPTDTSPVVVVVPKESAVAIVTNRHRYRVTRIDHRPVAWGNR